MKMEIFGHDAMFGENQTHIKHLIPRIKHIGGGVMILACFATPRPAHLALSH